MSLVRCGECNREISDRAAACSGCGAPVQVAPATTPSVVPAQAETAPAKDELGFNAGGAIVAMIGGFVLVAAVKLSTDIDPVTFGLLVGAGWLIVWIGIAWALRVRSRIVRVGGSIFLACAAAVIAGMLHESVAAPAGSQAALEAPRAKTTTDEVAEVLSRELDAQLKGDSCDACWSQDAERMKFKNLIEYALKNTFVCTQKGKEVSGIIGVDFRAKGQNGFGAQLWEDYQALVVRDPAGWRLQSITTVTEVGGQKLDICMLAGVTGLLDRHAAKTP